MVHRIEGKIHVENEVPEGEEERIEVTVKWWPAHYTAAEALGQRVKELRKKLDKFYEKLVEDYEA